MEFVDGQSLRAWQSGASRPWREIVEAYVQAGRGLAAAHAAGLVHRDFKPHNAMVESRAEGGVEVRVLDFGLARVRRAEISIKDEPTPQAGSSGSTSVASSTAVVGTPAYMAPEQILGRPVDARTDQFSFCVALWEGLYGEHPFAADSAEAMAARAVEGQRAAAPSRGVPARITAAVERGLAPEPDDRWPSMDALLDQLDERRGPRRGAARIWAGLALALVAGMVGVGVGLVHYAEAERRCSGGEARLEGLWDPSRQQAIEAAFLRTQRSYAPTVWASVKSTLDEYTRAWVAQHVDACEATSVRGEQSAALMDLRMRCLYRAEVELAAVTDALVTADAAVVDRAHELVETLRPPTRCADVDALSAGVAPPPSEQASTVDEIWAHLAEARTERYAGRYTEALAKVEEAEHRLATVEYGPVRTDVSYERGRVLEELGRYEESETTLRQSLREATQWRQWDELHRAAARLMMVVGSRQGRMEHGLRYRELTEALASGDLYREAKTANIHASVLFSQGKHPLAEAAMRRALQLHQRLPRPDPVVLGSVRGNLAAALNEQGKSDEAVAEARRAVELMEPILGREHPEVTMARNNLAVVLFAQGEYREAEREHRRVLEQWERALGSEHPNVAMSRGNLALALLRQGKYADAETELRRSLATSEQALGPEHPSVAMARGNLSIALREQGDYEGAEAEQRRALEIREQAFGPEHPDVLASRLNLGTILIVQGKIDEAEAEFLGVLERSTEELGPEHPRTIAAHLGLVHVFHEQGRTEEEERELRRVLELRTKTLKPGHPMIAVTQADLAEFLLTRGQPSRAQRWAEQAWARLGQDDIAPARRARAAFLLARSLWPEPEQRPQARALAQQAGDAYAPLGEPHGEALTAVQTWLREHPLP